MQHTTTATLYIRTPAPMATEKRQETILGRLESLRRSGAIDEVTVTYWFRQARVDDSDPVMPSVVALEKWAADHDVVLTPAFNRHDRANWYTGAADSVVSLPVICLAVFFDGEITGVYPHVDSSGYQSVLDGLDSLEAAKMPERYPST